MSDQKIGAQLDSLGVEVNLEDGEALTDVIVVGKVARFDGEPSRICISSNESCDWITKLGLIHAATTVIDGPIEAVGDDE